MQLPAARLLIVSLSLLSALCTGGCSKAHPTGTVRARVTLDGKPVTGAIAIVTCHATRQSFIEKVNPSGEFALPAPVPIGMYAIKLRAEDDPGATRIPKKYRRENTSGLDVDVKEGVNEYDLKLDSSTSENAATAAR